MGYGENRGSYWRGRYKRPGGYGTVAGPDGRVAKFRTRREAKQAADAAEAEVRGGTWRDPRSGRTALGEWATRWHAAQDLAPSTMRNYRRHLEEHILPAFETWALADLTGTDIDTWERSELDAGYSPESVRTWRATFHLVLADAVEAGLIPSNPATKRRGRGRRTGRSRERGTEKVIVDATTALLVAERAALLSGRDDEFVLAVLAFYSGARWGELIGLEKRYVRDGAVRVEWQLYELDTGELVRCPPKSGSDRTIDLPPFLASLLARQTERAEPCQCHGFAYVFRGGAARSGGHHGVSLADVAARAGVSGTTVTNVLRRPERVSEHTRARVRAALADTGFTQGAGEDRAPHWRRSGFASWVFGPAGSGLYARRGRQEARAVPLLAEPWPGVPTRGRGAAARAQACWTPVAAGLTPHGLRHSHRTLMEELGTEKVLVDERMGHLDNSVSARYVHVTPGMRERLTGALTRVWEESLDARAAMAPGSPVPVLDGLLREREAVREGTVVPLRGPVREAGR